MPTEVPLDPCERAPRQRREKQVAKTGHGVEEQRLLGHAHRQVGLAHQIDQRNGGDQRRVLEQRQPIIRQPRQPVAPKVVERQADGFWERFGAALGVDLEKLDHDAREVLAVQAARLLKQSIGGLQQSLRTRSELKNELRLAQTLVQGPQKNPLKFAIDAGEALDILLQPSKPGQMPAEQAVSRAFRDLQAHQVALLTASRAAIRATLEHFSPQQLTLRFERDNKPLLATSGSRWRAYGRYHQALRQDDDWSERLLARDFAQAYEEQIRLISTLNIDLQG
ncbi:type VI secretion system-associated FHA domain protein TagH [Pseudomonas extremaustralis]|uniref:type VI secretion system-associated FHA domain protein TagH n=1 Tax=Pseudomonas extremaustralis TaxID=359110 RepID=UPI0021C6D29A|nr:type VI secretion system-associated FHA domain protein TagH [Pseudomonas extremaustralis]MDG2970512.1 type VI secretion system-associated FHA domain protein TagH [Pseudomonas extremaustralis]UUJ40065.1 type VI secretion system-associated FHA domain protein TagH [Pseudomonas extremaustralis]